ncbi:Hypothetical predicted protein [Cloeon dipterum]|uniref:C2H2-type domain-containing protein n=1 Tax=Cloeon dipterum TaxID=197152 RepID=A0A8S1D836_9INSE|nr:Hypothetical predicted protein [Cloeon dipterum]
MSEPGGSTARAKMKNISCRFCLTKDTALFNIYKDGPLGKPVVKIKNCIPHFKRTELMNLSKFICYKCLAFVDDMEKFLLRAKTASQSVKQEPSITSEVTQNTQLMYSPTNDSLVSKNKTLRPFHSQGNRTVERVTVPATSYSQGCKPASKKFKQRPSEEQKYRVQKSERSETNLGSVKTPNRSPVKKGPPKLTTRKSLPKPSPVKSPQVQSKKGTPCFVPKYSSPNSNSTDMFSDLYCHLCRTRLPMDANLYKHIFDVHSSL